MKFTKIILTGTLLVSMGIFAQKSEYKTLKKIYDKDSPSANDVQEYKSTLDKYDALASEESDKVYADYFRNTMPMLEMSASGKQPDLTTLQRLFTPDNISKIGKSFRQVIDYEKKSGKKVFTDKINESIVELKPMLTNVAVAYSDKEKNSEAASVLNAIYQMDNSDPEKLYYAANYAIKANDMNKALEYYQELKAINYSGEGTAYFAKDASTGIEESFTTKSGRDNFVKLKTHNSPREEKIPSKRGEIYKNIALILVQNGKTEEAKAALTEARIENPNDIGILTTEADLYYKLGNTEKYKSIISEAIARQPNNTDLIYNLGILSITSKDYKSAEMYFQKVIDLDPNNINAYVNLSDVKLVPDAKIVADMNKLGVSDKEQKQYDVLKVERKRLFNSVLPILEKAYQLTKTNTDVKQDLKDVVNQNLKLVYNYLGMSDKAKTIN